MVKRVLEQHIAVFGESGSGKTVLLSSFYGLMAEKKTQEKTRLIVVADDTGQNDRLLQGYYGMSREGKVPPPNRFSATPYVFTARVSNPPKQKKSHVDAVRLVWHDYPGEWFHQSPSGPEEARRREETFRSLLASDVALVLIDGQQMALNAGQEEKYLKLLFTNIRNGLLPAIDAVTDSGKQLERFPRIWMFAMSKADILPNVGASELHDLVILKAAHEVDQLRRALQGAVDGNAALSVGEDFLLLSSAKFSPDEIDVDERVGVDLIMPIAGVLPVRRFLRWAERRQLRRRVLLEAIGPATAAAGTIAVILGQVLQWARRWPRVGVAISFLAAAISEDKIRSYLDYIDKRLNEAHSDALKDGDYIRAALAQFGMDLDDAEEKGVLLRSRR